MRRALKRVLVPALVSHGFVLRGKGYQRREGEFLDLLSVQYWKYGGEFILEFVRRKQGPLQTNWGPLIPEDEIDVAYVAPLDRARLQQLGSAAGPSLRGFQFVGFGEESGRYKNVAQAVVVLLPQVDQWLKTKQTGPNVHPVKAEA